MAGKLVSRVAVAASTSPGGSGQLCYLVDEIANHKFLVDTGAAYSVVPFSSTDPPHGPAICTADKSLIPCWGVRTRDIRAGGQLFTWTFLKAKVAFPILGADFLQHFDLWVDLGRRRLFRRGGRPIQLQVSNSRYVSSGLVSADSNFSSPSVEALENVEALGVAAAAAEQVPPAAIASQVTCDLQHQMEKEFPAVFNSSKLLPPVTHDVQHHIVTEGRPAASKYWRLDSVKLQAAKKEFEAMEQQGIVRRSKSSWASPLHMVKKKDGSWRPCEEPQPSDPARQLHLSQHI